MSCDQMCQLNMYAMYKVFRRRKLEYKLITKLTVIHSIKTLSVTFSILEMTDFDLSKWW